MPVAATSVVHTYSADRSLMGHDANNSWQNASTKEQRRSKG